MRRRTWLLLPWLGIVLGGGLLLSMSACDQTASRASAATEHFGPKEAEVTQEGDWKAVHLTASKFQWQFRDDQEPVEVKVANGRPQLVIPRPIHDPTATVVVVEIEGDTVTVR